MNNEVEFNLLEAVKKLPKGENPYRRFSLSGNPFPKSAIADPTSETFFSRCRNVALTKMKRFLIYAYASQRWSGLTLTGEYGSGKSHMLLYVVNEVNRQLGKLENDRALAIYVENPKESINELYKDIMDKIGRDNFESQVAAVIEETVFDTVKQMKHQQSLMEMPKEAPQDPLFRLRELGKRLYLQRNEAWENISKNLTATGLIQARDFARCLSILTIDKDQETRNAAWRFSTGQALTKGEAKNLGLVSERLSEDEIITYVFPSVIRILNKNGIAMLILFIDELEKLAPRPKNYVFAFLENLRSLIDNNLRNFSMIFACVDEAWDTLASISPGFSERISETVALDPLADEDASLLIEDYLQGARPRQDMKSTVAPFEEDAIPHINRLSRGSIRYILQNCHIILERAVSNPQVEKEITAGFVEATLGG